MTEEETFDLVRRNYCEANKDYLAEQIAKASEHLLKPCPFCGRDMKLIPIQIGGFETNLIRHADDAQIPCLLFRGFTWDGSVEETVKMWNMRDGDE